MPNRSVRPCGFKQIRSPARRLDIGYYNTASAACRFLYLSIKKVGRQRSVATGSSSENVWMDAAGAFSVCRRPRARPFLHPLTHPLAPYTPRRYGYDRGNHFS